MRAVLKFHLTVSLPEIAPVVVSGHVQDQGFVPTMPDPFELAVYCLECSRNA